MSDRFRATTLAGFVMRLAWAAVGLSVAAAAHAGGYDTGERDWDFLFQQDQVAVEAATRYIDPHRTLTGVVATGPMLPPPGMTASVRESAAFSVERASVAARLGDRVRCMGSYREPWGGRADYGSMWAASGAAITQDFTSKDIGVTCALSKPLAKGQVSLVGGVSYQEINYALLQNVFVDVGGGVLALAGTSATDVGDSGAGWRGGVAYEIPEYALRASLIYNSPIDYAMTGTVMTPGGTFPVSGSITMPQSVELRAQSGIAPGWLAFGSIKWTDWSADQAMPLCVVGVAPCMQVSGLTLLWKDTWTVTVGAAHQFSEMFSLAGSLTWDQGATKGFTSQTDTWVAGLTAVVMPHKNVELKLGGTIGVLTGGSLSTAMLPGGIVNPVGYTATFGNDLVYSLSASAALHY